MGEKTKDTNEDKIKAELERQEAERARRDEEHKKTIEEQRKLAQEAAEKAARAEGALEALKNFQAMQGNKQPEWTQEQWDEFKEKTGISKDALVAIDGAVGAKISDMATKFEERTRQAEERAKKAEERYNEFEKTNTYSKIKTEYFKTKPQFARYEKEIDEFLSDYPTEIRQDKEKMGRLLEKAETFIKGKVGDKGFTRNTGSPRFNGTNDMEDEPEEVEADLSDLRSHERVMVEKILPSKENTDLLKKYRHDLKGDNGVMISSKEEFDKYKK